VIAVKLKEQMRAYEVRTGGRLTYEQLAGLTGLSRATIEAIASRGSYNTTLATIEKLCVALGCQPGDLLILGSDV
jgi:putative transcriptional regulator